MVHSPVSLSALRSRVSVLEEELCAKALMMKSVQSESEQSKKELAAKELSIQRARDELSMAHTRIAQENGRVNMYTMTNIQKVTVPPLFCACLSFVVLETEWALSSL